MAASCAETVVAMHEVSTTFFGGREVVDDDYERCVRLIMNTLSRDDVESVDTASIPDKEWKWMNFLNRIEAKVKVAVKYVSVFSKQFCKGRTAEGGFTGRKCMSRVKNELKTRIDGILDEVFRLICLEPLRHCCRMPHCMRVSVCISHSYVLLTIPLGLI